MSSTVMRKTTAVQCFSCERRPARASELRLHDGYRVADRRLSPRDRRVSQRGGRRATDRALAQVDALRTEWERRQASSGGVDALRTRQSTRTLSSLSREPNGADE